MPPGTCKSVDVEAKQISVQPMPEGSEQDFNLPYDAPRSDTEDLCDERALSQGSSCRRTSVVVLTAEI